MAMCPGGASSAVTKFMVTCLPGEILDNCIPTCEASTNGDVLMLTQNGNDMRLLCTLSNFLYSWVGAAALGGFLGQNVAAFVSAVISGAAGAYVLTLTEDANVGTDLAIQPGQNVIISGDIGLAEAPSWGIGFIIQQYGSLSLSHLSLKSHIMFAGEVNLHRVTLEPTASLLMKDRSLTLLSMSTMVVPLRMVSALYRQTLVRELGSGLRFHAIILQEDSTLANKISGSVTVQADGTAVYPPALLHQMGFGTPTFVVESGPCTLSRDDQCVGRPDGYGLSEVCRISVSGGGGLLERPSIFDLNDGPDYLRIPGNGNTHPSAQQLVAGERGFGTEYRGGGNGNAGKCVESDECEWNDVLERFPSLRGVGRGGHGRVDANGFDASYMCDVLLGYDMCYGRNTWDGQSLYPNEVMTWHSDQYNQGSCNQQGCDQSPRPCETDNLCGATYSDYNAGGGWEVCFA
jgi:hypothetical protein